MLKIATPNVQDALDAYLAACREENRAIGIRTDMQNRFRELADMTEGTLVLATRSGQPVIVQQNKFGQVSIVETEERAE